MRLQSVAAKIGFTAFLLAALNSAIAVGGTRLGFWGVLSGYRLMIPALSIAAVALLASALWLILALKRNSGEGKRIGLIGLIGAMLVLYGPLGFAYRSLTMPPIGDVTTDSEHPPQFTAPGRAESSLYDGDRKLHFHGQTLTIASLMHDYYPEVTKPYAQLLTPAKMFWRGFETAKDMGWNIVSFDAKEGRIEAVATSLWFGRKVDVAIRVRVAGTLGARLDIRCENRDRVPDAGFAVLCVKSYLKALSSR